MASVQGLHLKMNTESDEEILEAGNAEVVANLNENSSENALMAELISSIPNELVERVMSFLEPPNSKSEAQNYFISAIASKNIRVIKNSAKNEVVIEFSDWKHWIPLHYAASNNNIEGVCILLSYGADPRIKSKDGKETALTLAYDQANLEVMKVLLNYYYEFTNVNLTNIILDYEDDINHWEDILLLMISLRNGYVEPFKLIWSRIDIDELSILSLDEWFFHKFLHQSAFSSSEWLDCLYYMTSHNIDGLRYLIKKKLYFLQDLLTLMKEKNCRMDVFYLLLSMGINVEFYHVALIYGSCKLEQEFEAVIYAGNQNWNLTPFGHNFLYFILNSSLEHTSKNAYKYLYRDLQQMNDPNDLIPWFKYFSLPSYLKDKLIGYVRDYLHRPEEEIAIPLRAVPEIPSLLELGRLAIQKLINQTHQITKLYQFHDVVKELSLPKDLKDVLLFKKPIYK